MTAVLLLVFLIKPMLMTESLVGTTTEIGNQEKCYRVKFAEKRGFAMLNNKKTKQKQKKRWIPRNKGGE